ncbi:FAD-binding oxidoreductase [Silanimonas sp.]|uniref:FAD-binding oxidoreductase n=1 Tax=Silanimonas sp. TaxID=1929290 RepID=UPI0022CC864E|nr:FAD-binding oxidoreductase [Silanimonas sp.]MCZ8116330.1 FAD-binding oxidoreductase [Silanimonas sp.]
MAPQRSISGLDPTLVDALAEIVGREGIMAPPALRARPSGYGASNNEAAMLVAPATTAEVAAVLAACHAAGQTVVPQGGLTGLVGATSCTPRDIALSLHRMREIMAVDAVERRATVQAGATLSDVQECCLALGLELGVDIAARDACTIGGMVATNAGGAKVARHGMFRQHVLGLEAVLADGTVLDHCAGLRKDNTGYDWVQLLVGSEGTLAVVTKAVLRLQPRPTARATALVAAPTISAAIAAVERLERELGSGFSACEAMWPGYASAVAERLEVGMSLPEAPHAGLLLIIENEGFGPHDAEAALVAAVHSCVEDGLLGDGLVAKSDRERAAWWRIRDASDVLEQGVASAWSFDVSLPRTDWAAYVTRVSARVGADPRHVLYAFGHLADGNVHFLITSADPGSTSADAIAKAVYEELPAGRGSVSAEHGIGLEKRAWLPYCRTPPELALMRRIKEAFDPRGILNPGKLLG